MLCPLNLTCDNDCSKIIIISDTHLCVDDTISMNVKNRDRLVSFLQRLRITQGVSELVLNGDLLDEWFIPASYPAYYDSAEQFRKIAANNQNVVDAINQIISDRRIKVTYIPGNHDMLFDEDICNEIFPGINQARDVSGLGRYCIGRNHKIVIEHSHRYSPVDAPNPVSNKEITGRYPSILPIGYMVTRIYATATLEGTGPLAPPDPCDKDQNNAYVYYQQWLQVVGMFPLNEGYNAKIIPLTIDGYNGLYSVQDMVPSLQDGEITANLYANYQRDWPRIQEIDCVRVPIPFSVAMSQASTSEYFDNQARRQYFDVDPTVDVVVFGHTHDAKLIKYNYHGDKKIYANSGTWIDNNSASDTTCNFVVIDRCPDMNCVGVYVYNEDGSIQAIPPSTSSPEENTSTGTLLSR